MTFISATRLRIRSLLFLPAFALHAWRSIRQVKQAPGFQGGALLPDRNWTFWTLTAWESEASMRQFMMNGAHRLAMPRLIVWCDEASVAHWERIDNELPSWSEVDRRMRDIGRPSKVKHPSPDHVTLNYRNPDLKGGSRLSPAKIQS